MGNLLIKFIFFLLVYLLSVFLRGHTDSRTSGGTPVISGMAARTGTGISD